VVEKEPKTTRKPKINKNIMTMLWALETNHIDKEERKLQEPKVLFKMFEQIRHLIRNF
jgi:hypothetical protein